MIDAAMALERSVNALKEIAELGKLYDHPAAALQAAQAAMTAQRVANTITGQGWKFMSCSHCQELVQQASWLLIGYPRVNIQSEARLAS